MMVGQSAPMPVQMPMPFPAAPARAPMTRTVIILVLALVVVVAAALGVLFGVPGTDFHGLTGGGKPAAASGVSTDPPSSTSNAPSHTASPAQTPVPSITVPPAQAPVPAQTSSAASIDGYSTYSNWRYQYSVDYPTGLVAGPPPTNGDGQQWTSRDGTITYTIWGENVVTDTPADLVAVNTGYAAQGMTLTYSDSGVAADGSNWMVKSGVSADGATSFYCFSTAGPGSAVTMSWVWPTSQTQVQGWIDHAYSSLSINGLSEPH